VTGAGVRGVVILGATGSIGRSTLDVIGRHPDRFRVVGLTAHRQLDALFEQCLSHRPEIVCVADGTSAAAMEDRLRSAGLACEVVHGVEGLEAVALAPSADTVMAAIVGAAGLGPTLAAARAGKRVLLANKEALVMAGGLMMETVAKSGGRLLPIDSEHNAIFQALPPAYGGDPAAHGVRRIVLTASGGPFRTWSLEQMRNVSPEQACAHPNWVMGRKISVDSATLMNKGLEVIEAHWLFGAPPEALQVVVHPQSIVHSLVEYVDGSFIAQLGNPDMRTPIAHALAYPERIESGVARMNVAALAALSFEEPDLARFPCLGLAFEAMRRGSAAVVALNAANECAVEGFLQGALAFWQIPALIEAMLETTEDGPLDSIESILEVDRQTRRRAADWCRRKAAA
jgi:1-deoxy-D-xylulose-5-phosphate reductoisomerase